MKKQYSNALEMMLQGDSELSHIINGLVDGLPKSMMEKINANKSSGKQSKDGKIWFFEDCGDGFSIAVGNQGVACKDLMGLYLAPVTNDELKCWPKFEGEKLIGYITLYLYNKENPKEKPLQVNYDFNAKRVEKKVIMTITTDVNASFGKNSQKFEEHGLTEVHQRVVNMHYIVDTDKILKAKCR